jgi:hypothetical protein
MRTNRQLVVLILLLGQLIVACSGGGGGGGNGGGGGGNGGNGGGGGQVQIAGKWEGDIQMTERREIGQQEITCTLTGTLTLQLEQQESSVSGDGEGSAKSDGCEAGGEVTGRGTVTTGGRGISFTTFQLFHCALTSFTATVTNDTLTANVTGVAASPPACVLLTGHLQLHRTG